MKPLHLLAAMLILFGAALAETHPVPMIYQPLLPVTVKPGSSQFTLTVNGTGFAPGAVVNWNGSTRATSYISSSQVQAQISAADVAKPGTAFVTVVNPKPGGGVSNTIFFPIQTPAPYAAMSQVTSFSVPYVMAVADFNNDGILDLAGPSQSSDGYFINVYFGNGDGTFQPAFPNHTVLPVQSIAVGNFNQDNFPDVAAADGIGQNANIAVLTSSQGKFLLSHQVFRAISDSPLAMGDFNRDGNLDLLVSGKNGGYVFFVPFLGDGHGNFSQGTQTAADAQPPVHPAIGDFNGDGILDIALPNEVLLGNGDGTFQPPIYLSNSSGNSVSVADVNGDGKLDIVTNGMTVLLGNGDGTFTYTFSINLNLNGKSIPDALIGDFNGDGKLDVAIDGYLLLGNGDGTFQNPVLVANGASLALGDFNNDGKLDLVGASSLYLQLPAILSPTSLNFGNQNVGTKSKPQNITALNDGVAAVTITDINFGGADPHDFTQSNNCPKSLPVGSTCKIAVVFDPQAGGARSATLNLNYQGLGSPQTVALSGLGAIATVTLSPASMKFPLQLVGTKSSAQNATLTNTGTVAINISKIATSGAFKQTNNCPSSLPVSSNCQIQVEFAPVEKGAATGTLSVTDDATGSPQKVALSGTATLVDISPLEINFGNQGVGSHSSPIPVHVKNVGTDSLKIDEITIEGADPGDFSQTNNCGHSLAAGASCTIKVTFTPQAKGKRSASLELTDDGGASPQKVPLTGTGT
jgi:FG-GAP-like repeat/Abnormal spindle-like microcephaly-assoc'd, ASPM-SPD-2-Hydin